VSRKTAEIPQVPIPDELKTPPKRGPGRPKGSKNLKVDDRVVVEPSRCKKCGSTNRGPYSDHPRAHEFPGIRNGLPYSRQVWRRCRCLDCGQYRLDIFYED